MDINSEMFWVKYNKYLTNHTEVYQSHTPLVSPTQPIQKDPWNK